jgi:hypothetical protein
MACRKVYSVCSAKTGIPCAFMKNRSAGRVYKFFKAMLGEDVVARVHDKCESGIASVRVLRELTEELSLLTGHDYVLDEDWLI